jgi:hypothetical protein
VINRLCIGAQVNLWFCGSPLKKSNPPIWRI